MQQDTVATAPNEALALRIMDGVNAYVTKNAVSMDQFPAVVAMFTSQFTGLLGGNVGASAPAAPEVTKPTPAQIRKSITPEALFSFEDGKPYKTLKRHLRTQGLTVEQYKAKYGLPHDYPTTAPAYSERRSQLAKSVGLGRKDRPVAAAPTPAVKAPAAPKATTAKAKAPAQAKATVSGKTGAATTAKAPAKPKKAPTPAQAKAVTAEDAKAASDLASAPEAAKEGAEA